MDNQTLSIVEDNGFVRLVSALESQYSVPVESTHVHVQCIYDTIFYEVRKVS